MTAPVHFPFAGFLDALERAAGASGFSGVDRPTSPALANLLISSDGAPRLTAAARALVPVLHARKATLKAADDTALAADELRRYQKYAKPGRPSAHIVQLRQRQAAARQASSLSRQALIKAAALFVREANIAVPARMTLDVFIIEWLDGHVPMDDPEP